MCLPMEPVLARSSFVSIYFLWKVEDEEQAAANVDTTKSFKLPLSVTRDKESVTIIFMDWPQSDFPAALR